MRKAIPRWSPDALFLVGVGISLLLAVGAAWADYEAMSYFSTGASYEAYDGLRCPILLSRSETGSVSSSFANSGSEAMEPYYHAQISGLAALRQVYGHVLVHPGSTQDVTWAVDARDIDLPPFIFVKQDVQPVAGHRAREATCGILMLPLGSLRGQSVLLLGVLISMLCMLAGIILPAIGLSPVEAARLDMDALGSRRRLFQSLGVTSALALLAGLAGWWAAAVIFCVVSLFLLVLSPRIPET